MISCQILFGNDTKYVCAGMSWHMALVCLAAMALYLEETVPAAPSSPVSIQNLKADHQIIMSVVCTGVRQHTLHWCAWQPMCCTTTPAAQPEPAAYAGSSLAQTQDADCAEHQSASDNEDAASFKSATADPVEAAAENQVAQP